MAERDQIPVYQSYHKEPEDDVAVFIGAAREKAQAFQGKVNGQFEFTRDMTVYVSHYYFYINDADFGPLFLKVCSYAPWATKLYLNGDEWAKRQLEKKASPTKPWTMAIRHAPISTPGSATRWGPEDIDRVFGRWLRRAPLPWREEDRAAGYDWNLSIRQMEVSPTQVFDRPLRSASSSKKSFETIWAWDGLSACKLVFDRVMTKKTPAEFRSRVIQHGLHPSRHIQ